MAKYTGPQCRLCRRTEMKLFLKGDKCYTNKCPFVKRPQMPGQHHQKRMKHSDYGLRLREKQRARWIYGVLERQFKRYFQQAKRIKGVTGENLLSLLERRLDNVAYRLGFATSRSQARQLVNHGHLMVNGKKVDIPSYLVKLGDVIQVRDKETTPIAEAMEKLRDKPIPPWLELDRSTLSARVVSLPTRDQIDTQIEEQLLVEYYSK